MKKTSAKLGVALFISVLTNSSVYATDMCSAVLSGRPVLSSYGRITGPANPLTQITLGGVAESSAFTRAGVVLRGIFKPVREANSNRDGVTTYRPSSSGIRYDGIDYVEFPNSTSMTTTNPRTGETREFILTRGVRPYQAGINLNRKGENNPSGYVSDVLLFEMINGEAIYRHRILESSPEKIFFFEDPRISVIRDRSGQPHYYLSGTDYSPHVRGSRNPDVMNRYVELSIDANGLPLQVQTSRRSGKPAFKNMSPEPKRLADGSYVFADAKNATIAQNDLGQIVVRTRLRFDFGHEYVKRIASGDSWKYGEQVFLFRDFEHFESYNWNDALVDLFNKRSTEQVASSVAPLRARTIIRESDLTENLVARDSRSRLTPVKPKGLGPGTRPLRVERRGDKLYLADGVGERAVHMVSIPQAVLQNAKIQDGQTVYLTFDHEIRYYDQIVDGETLTRRNYTASIKIFDETLTEMIGYMPDVIQAIERVERGEDSGILDLQHVYPMGFAIQDSAGSANVRVYAGASDAHTTAYDFDIAALLTENRPANRWSPR